MKKAILHCLTTLLLLSSFHAIAQRRASIEKVSSSNKIDGAPIIILPKTAVKFSFAMVEFDYTRGDRFTDLVKLTGAKCTEDDIKKELMVLEKRYGVSAAVMAKMLKDNKEELKISKLDKDITTSFLSMADYDKIYKYIKLKSPLNSSLLNLVYDENGVLVSSKRTDESKLVPAIMSTLSAVAGIAGAIPKSVGAVGAQETNSCTKIDLKMLKKLDDQLDAYHTFLTADDIYNDKQVEAGSKKFEEDIAKSIGELFYSKEVTITPIRIILSIPNDKNPKGKKETIELFQYDKVNHKVQYNSAYAKYLSVSPTSLVEEAKTIDSKEAYTIELSEVPAIFDRNASLSTLMGNEPDKKTAVFNIPKTEQFRFLKPGGKASYIDTTIKVPQHGSVGYLSLRLSSLELTYDTNGELKSMIAEKKSSVDTGITTGATTAKELIGAFRGQTETEKLEEKAKMLELLKKIKDLEGAEE